MKLSIIILAAGKGTRMQSSLPKVLHKLAGKTLLERVVNTVEELKAAIYVVYGFGGALVREQLDHLPVQWIKQEELLGTGHAVMQAIPHIPDDHQVVVLVGDAPLVKVDTIKRLLEITQHDGVGLVSAEVADPAGLGRILHDQTRKVQGIVEERDASFEQRKIREINTGIIAAPAKLLKDWLPNLRTGNAQAEYYLTDIIGMAAKLDVPVHSLLAESPDEVLGINDRIQLAALERIFQRQKADALMLQGVTLVDPARFDVRGEINTAQDVTIDVNVILEGKIDLGENVIIGPNCHLKNVTLGKNVIIKANTVMEDAIIADNCEIGPFARIRPGTSMDEGAKVGNFVEVKKSKIGRRSKLNHLSYIGDAIIGGDVNIGAGTITCNYDGVNKHQTIIEDGVFIGSDSQLVAPVKIEKGAYIGSGSTITRNAPANKLTLSRTRQVTLENWKRPD